MAKPYRRSKLGRELAQAREYNRVKKSVLQAYTYWLLGGYIGAHRFYLGDYFIGYCIILFNALALLIVSLGLVSNKSLFMAIIVLIFDAIFVVKRTREVNVELDDFLKGKYELDS